MVGISRSRLWIAVIGLLLTGIVAINVITVSYSSTSGQIQSEIQSIQRQNSILKSQQIEALSLPRVQKAASKAGMILPATTDIDYRTYSPASLDAAVQRLAADGG